MIHKKQGFISSLLATGVLLGAALPVQALTVQVTIENLAPINGNALTPFWVGFHNGGFDIYDSGAPASAELEALAEDGNNGPLSDAFDASGNGYGQGVAAGPGGPLLPGEVATFTIDLDDNNATWFSYAAMILPSNDAFVANGDPLAHQLIDSFGNFTAIDIFLLGTSVLDAGTEVNDELPANTAFFGQSMPNTGVDEGGVVGPHGGFLPAGSGGILDDPAFANADFLRENYPIAQIRISAVPIPGALVLMMSGLVGLLGFARRT